MTEEKKLVLKRGEDATIGDVVNIKTWIPRRAILNRYLIIYKPDAPGYEGLIIRKPDRSFRGQMHIPGNTITHIEVIDHIHDVQEYL